MGCVQVTYIQTKLAIGKYNKFNAFFTQNWLKGYVLFAKALTIYIKFNEYQLLSFS